MRTIISRNPFTGAILQQLPFATNQQIAKQIEFAKEGYQLHIKRTVKDRIDMAKHLIPQIQKSQEELAKLITFETGKPLLESQFQVAQSIKICNYLANHRQSLMPYRVKTEAKKKTLIKYLPLGTILCVLPSHFPFLLTFVKALPQLMIGNGVLVSHSHSTPRVGKAVDKILKKAGFESGQYQIVWNNHDQISGLIQNQQIRGVSFTGSEKVGCKIAEMAGRHLKKAHMEVDFKSTLVLFEDGNLTSAVENTFKPGYFCSGQGVSPKRFIIHRSHYQAFKDMLIKRLNNIKYGDPLDKSVGFGPLTDISYHQQLRSEIDRLPSSQKIIFKGQTEMPFFPLTVVESENTFNSSLARGPIFQLIKAEDDQHCVALANQNKSSSVCFLFSEHKWQELGDSIETGCVMGNTVAYFDPHVPLGQFGAMFSRDGWKEGVQSLCNIKTSFIN